MTWLQKPPPRSGVVFTDMSLARASHGPRLPWGSRKVQQLYPRAQQCLGHQHSPRSRRPGDKVWRGLIPLNPPGHHRGHGAAVQATAGGVCVPTGGQGHNRNVECRVECGSRAQNGFDSDACVRALQRPLRSAPPMFTTGVETVSPNLYLISTSVPNVSRWPVVQRSRFGRPHS